MKQLVTAKLKLSLTQEQKQLMREVCLAYRDALNYTSLVAFEKGKLSGAAKLQKLVYQDLRCNYNLPSQMACNVPRQVAATYKGLWTLVKQNKEAIALGRTKKRYKGLDKPPKFVSRTCTLNFGRDYSWAKGQKVSVITLKGRIVVPYVGYDKYLEIIRTGVATVGAAKIWYNKSSKNYYLLVSLELEIPDINPEKITRIIGVDVGRRYLAVTTDTNNQTKFYSGSSVIHKANRRQKVVKTLQRKGTRSATRRLISLSGRERRFVADTNHCLAKKIATPGCLIGLEDLTHIRERTGSKAKGKLASVKQRRANRNQTKWSFAELHSFIDYKAVLVGSLAIKVDADYTSQGCCKCGYTSRENRPKKGLTFLCQACFFEIHADLLGARNIALRTLVSRQDWEATGRISAVPDVSDCEAKAERLKRFSELRWSLDAIPDLATSGRGS